MHSPTTIYCFKYAKQLHYINKPIPNAWHTHRDTFNVPPLSVSKPTHSSANKNKAVRQWKWKAESGDREQTATSPFSCFKLGKYFSRRCEGNILIWWGTNMPVLNKNLHKPPNSELMMDLVCIQLRTTSSFAWGRCCTHHQPLETGLSNRAAITYEENVYPWVNWAIWYSPFEMKIYSF